MGYPPGWIADATQTKINMWKKDHPNFPWAGNFTEAEKNAWIDSIPYNGPQPGITWDEYNIAKFIDDLDKAFIEAQANEMPISERGRIRVVPCKDSFRVGWKDIIIEVCIDDVWHEVFRRAWSGKSFNDYYNSDIPKALLIESQMIDLSFLARYSWASVPMAERYKNEIAKAAGTCAWALMTMSVEAKGLVFADLQVLPIIDEEGILKGYKVNASVSETKAGYVIKHGVGNTIIVKPPQPVTVK